MIMGVKSPGNKTNEYYISYQILYTYQRMVLNESKFQVEVGKGTNCKNAGSFSSAMWLPEQFNVPMTVPPPDDFFLSTCSKCQLEECSGY